MRNVFSSLFFFMMVKPGLKEKWMYNSLPFTIRPIKLVGWAERKFILA